MELCRSGDLPIDRLCQIYPIAQFDQALLDLKEGKVSKKRHPEASHSKSILL